MVRHPPSPPALSRLRRRPPARLAALGLCALLVLAACSRSDEADGPTGTLGTTPLTYRTTTTEAPTPEEAVEAAFRRAKQVFCSYMEDPDRPLDDLRATRAGASLQHITKGIKNLRESGGYSTYPNGCPVPTVFAVQVDEKTAVISSCETNDAVLWSGSGDVENDDVVTRTERIELALIQGHWRITNQEPTREQEGSVPCVE